MCIRDRYKKGPQFNTDVSILFHYFSFPHLLAVDFEYAKDTNFEIRFDDIIKAIEAANDSELKVAFDKQVLQDAIAAIAAKDPRRVLDVSMRLQTQVDRYKRAIAVAMDERIAVLDSVTKASIAPEHRTKPITKKKAARLLGREGDASAAVEWLSSCIRDGTIKAEKKTRQSYVFDIREFPEEQHDKLKASQGE